MHEKFLFTALEEAKKGIGRCAPNPSVGAVAVKNFHVIAKDWHRGAGSPHAERLVIDKLPMDDKADTLYVTLEPCSHFGRTPPCVDAIIEYGFQQVVYGYRDPNPLVVKNHSTEKLCEHGIRVMYYPLDEIHAFYQPYEHWTQTKMPWVVAKIAQSFDGKIAGPMGKRLQLSNEHCHIFTHEKRLQHDVILTTSRTIQQDNPKLNVRMNGEVLAKPVAILDRLLSLSPAADIFSTAKHCHVFYDKQQPCPQPRENCTFHPVSVTPEGLCLQEVLKCLGHAGFHAVWVEAGGVLFTGLHLARLVNRTYVYLVPKILGDDAISAYHLANTINQPAHISWMPMGDNVIAILDWRALDII
jgi:diaminohydroxyphosphoribosylaminopyrimidine deaminase/5-amino-6-(5-phosphoribosylamino)uracil reductase